MYYDIIIIGGGAAGMCTAIKAKNKENSILIIEHNDRVGKKILSTGNGKCNLTNSFCKKGLLSENPEGLYPYQPEKYKDIAESVIDSFDYDDTLKWFLKLGILTYEKEGYVYPLSEQASSVLNALRENVLTKGIHVITDYQPMDVIKTEKGFSIDNEFECRNLVLATGGMSAPKTGSDGSGYEIAKKLGHTIIKPFPALCGIKCEGDFFKSVKGVRADCIIRIFEDDPKAPLRVCRGNVQFNDYGVSGIPVMQVSSFAGRMLDEGHDLTMNISLLPALKFEETVHFISDRLSSLDEDEKDSLTLGSLLHGVLNKKLTALVYKEMGLSEDLSITEGFKKFKDSDQYAAGIKCAKHISEKGDDIYFGARIAGVIKHFRTKIKGLCGFDEAQTTSGGVSMDEIDPETMMSRLCDRLFFAGEIMDVDGICGGYNLQWAWSSAHICAKHVNGI